MQDAPCPPNSGGECGPEGESPTARWIEWMAWQQQISRKNVHLFQVLAEHHKVVLEQLMTSWAQANGNMWEQVTYTLEAQVGTPTPTGGCSSSNVEVAAPYVKVQKMTLEDDPEEYLNTFERTPRAAR